MLRAVAILCLITGSLGWVLADQGRSEPYKEYLNQPKPEWLNIGEPIKIEVVDGIKDEFFSKAIFSDELKATKYTISIPRKNISIKFNKTLAHWYLGGDAGETMLSPDGKKLLVETVGAKLHLYEILGLGSYREIDFNYPELTFDSPVRGIIGGWRWVSNDVLLADSGIATPDTGEQLSHRVYTYHWKERILSRLALDSLNLDHSEGEILGVSQDANYIRVRLGGDTYTLKADLNSTPKLLKKEPVPGTSSVLSPSLVAGNQVSASGSRPSGNPFPWLWLLAIVGVMLGVFSYLYRSSRPR